MSFNSSLPELVANSDNPLVATNPLWSRIPLAQVARIINGFPLPSNAFNTSDGTPVIRIRDVTAGRAGTFYTGPVPEGFWVENGDIVIGMDGDFNSRVWQGGRALLNQRVCKLVVDEQLYDLRLLAYLLPGYLQLINEATPSITVKHLSSKTIGEIPLPYPNLEEQRRLVAKLDALFANTCKARQELLAVPKLVERYKQALLAMAFSGQLTPNTDTEWSTVRLGQLITKIEAGKNLRCEERPPLPHERGIVKVSSVTWGAFNPRAAKTPAATIPLASSALIQSGDFLISRANTQELVGACVIVGPLENNNLYLSDKILRLRFNQPVERWVMHYLRSKEGREQLEAQATGNQFSMRNISQEAIREIRLPLPTLATREEVLQQIEAAFKRIERLGAEAKRSLALLDRLEAATLSHAFSGRLLG